MKIDRRQFIRTATVAGVVGCLGFDTGHALDADLADFRFGIGPGSWGVWFADDARQPPWQRFLDEVVEAGYKAIELGPYGYLPTQVDDLRAQLARRNLGVSAGYLRGHLESFEEWPRLEKQLNAVGMQLAEIEAKYLIVVDDTYSGFFTGGPAGARHLDQQGWKHLIDTTHRVADAASKRFGLRLTFHPYAYSHVENIDQIETFLEQTDPSHVSLCVDTGHFALRGIDVVDFLRRHSPRVSYLHLQDVNEEIRRRLLGEDSQGTLQSGLRIAPPYVNAVEAGLFCEPGKGIVSFSAVRDALRETHFKGWTVIEQEVYSRIWSEAPSISKRSLAYFQNLRFAV